ncbi:MAG TPA: hypothetical protein VH120_17630 [Gemmataceae bacterium]|nr:hypothetical protein [Gemmataceae bacterium]
MMRFRTPMMTPAQTTAQLQRELRINSVLRRDLRFDRFLDRREFGSSPFGSPFGMFGGGVGSGGALLLGGGLGGTTVPAAANPTATTEDTARSALLLEQAVGERLDNRRKAFDELRYERDKTPTREEELLGRSRATPPSAEVLSGQALNALLDDLRTTGAGAELADRPNPRLPLDEQDLKHINVTRGAGGPALLKDGGRLTWPTALTGTAFQGPRERLSAQAVEVVRQAGNSGRVDPGALRQMADDVDQLRLLLRQHAKELSFQPYNEARDYLQRFDDALAALGRPDAADYFNGKYELKAQTVLGLVKQMTDLGLRFAPATPGDEAAYAALRDALAAYDRTTAKPQSAAR